MSDETKGARKQANARVDLLQQPERAKHRPPRGDWTAHIQPPLPRERRQVLDLHTHRVVLALNEPFPHLIQVGQSADLRRDLCHQERAILLHKADSSDGNLALLGEVHTKRRIEDGVIAMNVGNGASFKMSEIESGPGHTATLAAVGRAIHANSERPLVSDHLALGLAGEAGASLLAQLTSQLPDASRQSLGLAFAIRTRYVEDAVARAIEDGIDQYVILGAGLDSFAYRRADLGVRLKIFEVDRASSQAWKRRRLEELGVAIPSSVSFVPLDHETDDLRGGLALAGFDDSARAIVSAIALTQYLAQPAIESILKLVASLPSGSRLVITYVVPPTELSETAAAGLAWTMSQAEERGERFVSLFRPADFDDLLKRAGFSRVEEAGPRELLQMYLADRPDAQLTGIERLAAAWV